MESKYSRPEQTIVQIDNPNYNPRMKMKQPIPALTLLSLLALASSCLAQDVIVYPGGSGNWSSTVPNQPWTNGTIPAATNGVWIMDPSINITVDTATNVYIGFLEGQGAVTMAANSTLILLGDSAGAQLTSYLDTFDATASNNTVILEGNIAHASTVNYYNLVMSNTTGNASGFYTGPYDGLPGSGFNIANDCIMYGSNLVQQSSPDPGSGDPETDITIGHNLIIGTNSIWDPSGSSLTVMGDTFVYGMLEDLNGALGTNTFMGNITIYPGSRYLNIRQYVPGWYVSDVTQWELWGNLTNYGTIFGHGGGCINLFGTNIIAGNPFTLPGMFFNGTTTIETTLTLSNASPVLLGTLQFDLANPGELIVQGVKTNILFWVSGNLNVLNSGPAPASGTVYHLLSAYQYTNNFASVSLPTLPNGLSWVNNLTNNGTISVTGTIIPTGSPTLKLNQSGSTLTLSWDSTTYPGFKVQAQTNSAGLGSTWYATGSTTTSPFVTTINPSGSSVFFRLSNK
jgi:hypothetical protein